MLALSATSWGIWQADQPSWLYCLNGGSSLGLICKADRSVKTLLQFWWELRIYIKIRFPLKVPDLATNNKFHTIFFKAQVLFPFEFRYLHAFHMLFGAHLSKWRPIDTVCKLFEGDVTPLKERLLSLSWYQAKTGGLWCHFFHYKYKIPIYDHWHQ